MYGDDSQTRTILEAAGEGIYGLDTEGRVTFANPAAARMVGREAEDLVGQRIHEDIHHSHPDGSPYPLEECPLYTTLRDGEIHHSEDEVFWRADGTSFPVSYTATPIFEDGRVAGAVAGAVVTFSDITERKRSEEALRQSELRFRAFVSATSDAVYKMSADWREMQSLIGKEFIADTENPRHDWTEHYIPEEDKPNVWAAIEEAIRTRSNFELEHRVIQKDGTIGWTFSRAVPMLDGAGEIVEWLGTASDITERKRAGEALRGSEERLQEAISIETVGVLFFDLDDGITGANQAFERMSGYGREELGDSVRWESLTAPEYMSATERAASELAESGETSSYEKEMIRKDGSRWWALCAPRLLTGSVSECVEFLVDITERKRAEAERERALAREQQVHQRTEFLSEVSRRLADSLDWEQTLSEIARLAVPGICDLCIVDTLDAPGGGSTVRRLAVAHHDPVRERRAWELEEHYPVSKDERSAVAEVIRTKEPVLVEEVTEEWLEYISQDEGQREIFEALDLGSIAIVPLATNGYTLGAMTLATDGSGRRYGEEDLTLASDLARRAAQAMDNARLYAEQSHAARTLQQSLLPPSLPEIPGVEAVARYRPAASEGGYSAGGYDIGGDFYDVFETPTGWDVVVGDVMGKGVEAAELTAMTRYTVRTAAMDGDEPSQVLRTLNAAMLSQRDDLRFATMVVGRLNPLDAEDGETAEGEAVGGARLTLCRGGHPPPLILRADGSIEEADAPGALVGVMADAHFEDQALTLSPEDALVLYTDGVIESRNPQDELFGGERLQELVSSCCGMSADQMADELERGVEEFQQSRAARDDIAIVVLKATARQGVLE